LPRRAATGAGVNGAACSERKHMALAFEEQAEESGRADEPPNS
jgi:hypothetical protein